MSSQEFDFTPLTEEQEQVLDAIERNFKKADVSAALHSAIVFTPPSEEANNPGGNNEVVPATLTQEEPTVLVSQAATTNTWLLGIDQELIHLKKTITILQSDVYDPRNLGMVNGSSVLCSVSKNLAESSGRPYRDLSIPGCKKPSGTDWTSSICSSYSRSNWPSIPSGVGCLSVSSVRGTSPTLESLLPSSACLPVPSVASFADRTYDFLTNPGKESTKRVSFQLRYTPHSLLVE